MVEVARVACCADCMLGNVSLIFYASRVCIDSAVCSVQVSRPLRVCMRSSTGCRQAVGTMPTVSRIVREDGYTPASSKAIADGLVKSYRHHLAKQHR